MPATYPAISSHAYIDQAYADFVLSRAARIDTSEDHLLHAAAGLLGEWIELEQAGTAAEELGELGDVLYYFTLAEQWFFTKHMDQSELYLSALENRPPNHCTSVSLTLQHGRQSLSFVLNYAKKHWAYKQPPAYSLIAETLALFLSHYNLYLKFANTTGEEVVRHNVEKLTTRYPSGRFTTEHSVLRLDGTEDK